MTSDPALAAFGASLSAITLAELGDKTFFVALLLAARHRPRWVFLGAFLALAVVTVLSLALGFGLRQMLPLELVPWLAATLFAGFGLKLLIDAQAMGAGAAAAEEAEAEELVEEAEARQTISSVRSVIGEAFLLVFLAELGDRTQFATVFLAAGPSFTWQGLLAGSLLGHGLVTAFAVGAGSWIGGRIDERLLYRLSGGLFLVFALFSLRQAMS